MLDPMLRLQKHKALVQQSRVFQETREAVQKLKVKQIRCLALGSPCTEPQAPYQLAYLVLVAELLKVSPENVSVYDPVFDDADTGLLTELGYVVSPQFNPSPNDTLYYMPHCPRSVAEQVFNQEQPHYVLGNDISVIIGTLSAASFLQQYPLLAHMNKIYETEMEKEKNMSIRESSERMEKEENNEGVKETSKGKEKEGHDGFTVVRRKNKNRKQYVEPVLPYDYSRVYCSKVQVVRIHSEEGPWRNSFSDLALNIIE